ncbi:MAG TPA: MMPL family transporter [Acidimicrobiales bacterium]|nr:MMPL family transporter [Acidimicrobiales bacterium]
MWVVLAWMAVAVVVTATAPSLAKVGVQDLTSLLPASAPSQRAQHELDRLYPSDPTLNSALLVFTRNGKLTEADHAAIADVVTYLRSPALSSAITRVESAETDPALASQLRSADGHAELVITGFTAAPFSPRINKVVGDLRDHIDAVAPAGLQHHVSGVGGLAADQANGLLSSFDQTAIITVLLVLFLLVLVYRSAVAPLIPLLTIGLAFVVAQGVIGVMAAHGFKVASLAGTLIIVMVFGAGTDYCLFIVSRYREELAAGDARPVTLRRTMTIIGAVITASAATVIVGFMSQLSARFGLNKTMGPAIGVAIFVTLLAGLTLTPALLRLTGRFAFWPARSEATVENRSATRWDRLAAIIRAYPTHILLAAVIALELPAAGLGWFRESFDLVHELPAAADARRGFDALSSHFTPGTLAPVYVVIDANGPITDAARLAAVDRLTDKLRDVPGVGQVRSLTQPGGAPLTPATFERFAGAAGGDRATMTALGMDPDKVDLTPLFAALASPEGLRFTGPLVRQYPQLLSGPLSFFQGVDGHSTRLLVELRGNPYDRHALPVIRNLDQEVNRRLAGTALSGARLSVGGPAAFFADMQTIGNRDFKVMTSVLIGGIFVVLALLLQSLVAPFYLLASVVLSYAATMGLTTAVFVGLGHEPGLSFWLPPFLFVILVALGADYNIFIMSRIREEAVAGAEIHDAVTRGLTATGGVITSAGLILAGTFAALAFAPLPELRQIGFAVTVGVLIDTFVVRSLLVPAATMLLGRAAFWPGMRTARGGAHARQWGFAGAGVAALAVTLVALAATSGTRSVITRIDNVAARPAAVTRVQAAEAVNTTIASTSSTTTPSTTTAVQPVSPATTAASPLPSPARVAVPATGSWQFHVEGTRKIGAAGSTQPYSEAATTNVSRDGGDDQAPFMRVKTASSNGSQDDRRRYAADGVSLVATQVSSSGVSYGGTLAPPELLVPWPLHAGASWSGSWTTGSVDGRFNGHVTGTRQETAAGTTYDCWVIQLSTTFTGAAQGQQDQTSCWVPALGMSIDDAQHAKGTYRGIGFDITSHAVLSARP